MTDQAKSAAADEAASILLPHTAQIIPLRLTGLTPAKTAPRAFTKATVKNMQCPPGRDEKLYWDHSCGGFGLRALSSGRRSWFYQYRDEHNKTRRMSLGDVTVVSLDHAREAARNHAATVVKGGNPSVARRAKRVAVKLVMWSMPTSNMPKPISVRVPMRKRSDTFAVMLLHFTMSRSRPSGAAI